MCQARMLGGQRFPLVRLRRERVQSIQLPVERVDALTHVGAVLLGLHTRFLYVLPVLVGGAHGDTQLAQLRVVVQ